MLSLPVHETFEGVTIFRDDDERSKFHYLPNKVGLVVNPDGTPQFDFVVYDIGSNPATSTNGGYLLFTVKLAEEDGFENRLRERLRPLVQQETEDGETAPQVQVAQVTFTKGQATLLIPMGVGDNAFMQRIELGKPALFGDNTLSVIAEMSLDGASLFAGVLEQGGSIAAIEYNMVFEARLPSIVVTAHIEATRVRDVVSTWEERTVRESNVWHSEVTESNRTGYAETLTEGNLVELEISLGNLDDGDEHVQDMVEGIQDFVFKTMDNFIEGEWIGVGGVLSEEDLSSDWLSTINENFTKNFDMSLTVRDVTERQSNPGTQLDVSFFDDGSGGTFDASEFVTRINIGEGFFRSIDLDVSTSFDFDRFDSFVHSLEVHIDYEGEDEDGNNLDKSFTKTFTKDDHDLQRFSFKVGKKDEYNYTIIVHYRGGPIPSRVVKKGKSSLRGLVAAVDNPGELDVTFTAAPEMFGDRISSVEVQLEYADPREDVPRFTEDIVLNKENPTAQIRKPIFAEMRKNFSYTMVYVMDGGAQRVTAGPLSGAPGTNNVSIPSPFEDVFAITIHPLADWNEMAAVIVSADYVDDANDFRKSETFVFDDPETIESKKWAFSVLDPDHKSCTISEIQILKQGGSIEKTPVEINTSIQPVLIVGNALGGVFTLEIDAADLDFENDVRRIIVNLVYSDEDNDVLDTAAIVFRNSADIEKWSIAVSDNSKRNFTYEVKYFMRDNTQHTVSDQQGSLAGITDFLFIAPPDLTP